MLGCIHNFAASRPSQHLPQQRSKELNAGDKRKHKAIDTNYSCNNRSDATRQAPKTPQKRRPHCTTRAVIKSARGSTTMDPTRATSPTGSQGSNDTPDLPHSMLFVPKFTKAREPRALNRDGTPVNDAVRKSSFGAAAQP